MFTYDISHDSARLRDKRCLSHIVLLVPPVQWGVRRSPVVTFAAIILQGPRFKPRPGQTFEMRFLHHACAPHTPPRGPQHEVPEPVPRNAPSASEESIEWVRIRRS